MWKQRHQGAEPRRMQMCRCHEMLGIRDQVQCLFWLFYIPSESPFTKSVMSALWKRHTGIDREGTWFLGEKQNKSVRGGTSTRFTGYKWKVWCLGKGKVLKNQEALQLAQRLSQFYLLQRYLPTNRYVYFHSSFLFSHTHTHEIYFTLKKKMFFFLNHSFKFLCGHICQSWPTSEFWSLMFLSSHSLFKTFEYILPF